MVEVATPASSAAALSGVPSSASACLNLDDFEKAAEALLKPKAWGACFLSAGRLCPSSLQHLPSLLILERLCIVAYYRSAADDERSKSLAPSSLPVFPELQAAETSASPPSPRQSTTRSLQLEPRRLLSDPFPTPRPPERPPRRPLDLDPRPPLEDAGLHLAGRHGPLGPPRGGEMSRTDGGGAWDSLRGVCILLLFRGRSRRRTDRLWFWR